MSILQAIANPMVPNIAQAVMQGEQGRIQQQQAEQQAQMFPLQMEHLQNQTEMSGIEVERARNPQVDFAERLNQLTAQNEIMYNTLSNVDDEASYRAAYATIRSVDREAPAQFDPEYVSESLANADRWRQNPPTPASIQEYRLAVEEGFDGTFQEWQDRNQGQEPPNLQRFTAVVAGESQPSQMSYEPDTGRAFRDINGQRQYLSSDQYAPVTVQGALADVLPPNRTDDIQANLDWTDFGIETIDDMAGKITADRSIVGVTGAARRAVRTGSGIIDDMVDMFGRAGAQDAREMVIRARDTARQDLEAGRIDEEGYNMLFGNPSLDELPLFENALTYMLARTWNPDDRLHAATLRDAKDNVRITGLTSSDQALNRLNYVREQLEARRNSLQRRLRREQSRGTPTFRWDPSTNTLESNGE